MTASQSQTLTGEELTRLIDAVFARKESERRIGILVDLPDAALPDHDAWRERRRIAAGWVEALAAVGALEPTLIAYRNARRNNADLPAEAWQLTPAELPATADELPQGGALPFSEVFASHPLLLAPTELSATAPLKVAAREHGFRAATMPGFSPAMIPALRLDYGEVNRRVELLQGHLSKSSAAELRFQIDGDPSKEHRLTLDLRFRNAHASGGLLHSAGTAGNLPSGEAYIVPYEGEREGEPSRSAGVLPVQLDDEVVLFAIENNRARSVTGDGPRAVAEREHLAAEPAYGNMSELGLGVLGDFGVEPIGALLLDEKLGLHIAFGRSEHFGGQVGPGDFSCPEAVIHLDRVYLPSTQPRVRVHALDLIGPAGEHTPLIADDRYVLPGLTP